MKTIQDCILEVDTLMKHPRCSRSNKLALFQILRDLVDLRDNNIKKVLKRKSRSVIMFGSKEVSYNKKFYFIPGKTTRQ